MTLLNYVPSGRYFGTLCLNCRNWQNTSASYARFPARNLFPCIEKKDKSPKGATIAHLRAKMPRKAFFNDLGQDAQNKYAQGQITQTHLSFELCSGSCKYDDDMIKMRALLYTQHFLHCKFMGKIFVAQGQVSPNWPEIEFLRDFMTVIVTCKFDKDPIENEGAIFGTTCSPS